MSDVNDEITLTAEEAAALRQAFTYCPRCRAEMVNRQAYGRVRRVCPACKFVQFIDPKVSVAVLGEKGGQVLLVKRAMDPAKGDWCMPGGFIELFETPEAAAQREYREETGAEIEITRLLDVHYYEDYRGSGVLIMYAARIVGGEITAQDDAEDVGFFGPDELPANIAFETNVKALAIWKDGLQNQ